MSELILGLGSSSKRSFWDEAVLRNRRERIHASK